MDVAVLADKLTKLNASQASVEALSAWCIFHRGSCRAVVAAWAAEVATAPASRLLPLFYLANDMCVFTPGLPADAVVVNIPPYRSHSSQRAEH